MGGRQRSKPGWRPGLGLALGRRYQPDAAGRGRGAACLRLRSPAWDGRLRHDRQRRRERGAI